MSEMIHRVLANAKVNLSLKVLGRRDDGFHALETRMAPISLADELEFYQAESYSLECDTVGVPLDETNLVTKSVRLFERETGLYAKWRVKLIKNIPHGAGLGGGSSDAAAVMRGLNELENAGLSQARMAEMLGEIGSDVPFFVYDSVCDCRGRGEIVQPVDWDHEVTLLLLKPSFGVSTPDAYKAWMGARELPDIDYAAQHFPWGEMLNDLEKPVFMKHLFLAEMKMWLLAQPEVSGAMMSGSGSTFMAVLNKQDGLGILAKARQELDPTLWGAMVEVGK
jgi:4-diphosphocytidyl-2-C-methyl-D-erythritol kinase